jgi:hypothetical protein
VSCIQFSFPVLLKVLKKVPRLVKLINCSILIYYVHCARMCENEM